MTNIELLDAIVERTKEILQSYKLRNAEKGIQNINVYAQNLPQKAKKNDTLHYPYVRVFFDEETIEEKDTISIFFIFGVFDETSDNQGYRDVLGMANKLYDDLFERPVVGEYRMDKKYKIMLQSEEDTWPYSIGGSETTWIKEKSVNMIPTQYD